jgi:DNA-binding transcriptional ArsR family regulator
MPYQSSRTDGFFALGDPMRRQVFERLARRELSVAEIAEGLPVSRPAVSQHLKVLKEARLVTEQQVGTRRIYRLDPRGVEDMRKYLDRFWDRALAAFKAAAEEEKDA